MFVCDHFVEARIKKIFNISAGKRAEEEKDLFELTHTPIFFYDPKKDRTDIKEDQLIKTISDTATIGTILFIIKGATGTSKSEFCVKLRKALEEQGNDPLTLYKGISYPDFLKKLIDFYEDRFQEPYPKKDKKNIESIINTLSIKGERSTLLWHITTGVFNKRFPEMREENPKEIFAKVVGLLAKGIERLADPQDQGVLYTFIDKNVYEAEEDFLNQYFNGPDDFNKTFSEGLYEIFKAPNIKQIIETISEGNRLLRDNKRIYIIFEDFSLEENESHTLFKFMLSDNPIYNITFIVAGTPAHLIDLEAEDTYRDRRRLYETQFSDELKENFVPTFKYNEPVEFIKKYLGYIKTLDSSLLINRETKDYELNKDDTTICNECGKCKSLDEIIFFPFNNVFIENIYHGIEQIEDRTPRNLIIKFSELLEEYIENNTPFFESTNPTLSNINAPKSTIKYPGPSQNFKNFIKWFGNDGALFEKLFPDEKIVQPHVEVVDTELKQEEGEITLIIPSELEELGRNIHKFISNPTDTSNNQINKINYYVFYALDNIAQSFVKKDIILSPLSDKITVLLSGGKHIFVPEGVMKEPNQIYFNIRDFSEEGLIFLLRYGFFFKENKNEDLDLFLSEKKNNEIFEMFRISTSLKIKEWRENLLLMIMNLDCSTQDFNGPIYIDDILISIWYYLSLLSNPGEEVSFKTLQANFNNDKIQMDPTLRQSVENLRDFNKKPIFDLPFLSTFYNDLENIKHLTQVFASHGGKYLQIKTFKELYDHISLSKYGTSLFPIYREKHFNNLNFNVRINGEYLKNYWKKNIYNFKKEIEKFKSEIYENLNNVIPNWMKYLTWMNGIFSIYDDEQRFKEIKSVITDSLRIPVSNTETIELMTILEKIKNYLENPPENHKTLKKIAENLENEYSQTFYYPDNDKKIIFVIKLLYFLNCELIKVLHEFIDRFYANYRPPTIEIDQRLKNDINIILNYLEIEDFWEIKQDSAEYNNDVVEDLNETVEEDEQEKIYKELYHNLIEFNEILKNDDFNWKLKGLLPDFKKCCVKLFVLEKKIRNIEEVIEEKQIYSVIDDFEEILKNFSEKDLDSSKTSLSTLENNLNELMIIKFENIYKRIEDLKALNIVLKEFKNSEINNLLTLVDEIKNFPITFEGDFKEVLEEKETFKNFEAKFENINTTIKNSFDAEVITLRGENAREFLNEMYYKKEAKRISDIDSELLENIQNTKFKYVLFIIFKNPEDKREM